MPNIFLLFPSKTCLERTHLNSVLSFLLCFNTPDSKKGQAEMCLSPMLVSSQYLRYLRTVHSKQMQGAWADFGDNDHYYLLGNEAVL